MPADRVATLRAVFTLRAAGAALLAVVCGMLVLAGPALAAPGAAAPSSEQASSPQSSASASPSAAGPAPKSPSSSRSAGPASASAAPASNAPVSPVPAGDAAPYQGLAPWKAAIIAATASAIIVFLASRLRRG